jgi:hypothetical protein
VISLTITASPPVNAVGQIALNRQNGLFEGPVRISNPTPRSFLNGVRLLIFLDSGTGNRVYNATGTNSQGTPYIDVTQPLPSGSNVVILVQYYVPDDRVVPNPTLRAEPLPYTIPPTPAPKLTSFKQFDGSFVVSFNTATNRLYYIQQSPDLIHWNQTELVNSTGNTVQRTNSPAMPYQFFRVLLLPY